MNSQANPGVAFKKSHLSTHDQEQATHAENLLTQAESGNDNSHSAFEEAFNLFKKLLKCDGDREWRGDACVCIGRAALGKGDNHSAFIFFNQAVAYYQVYQSLDVTHSSIENKISDVELRLKNAGLISWHTLTNSKVNQVSTHSFLNTLSAGNKQKCNDEIKKSAAITLNRG